MNLKQLEAFAAVMSLRTTIAAAQQLGLSQPAVSRLLGQFEADLGLTLFLREQGRLTATREAEAIADEVQTIIEASRCLERHAHQLRLAGTRRKLVRVMVPGTFAQFLLPTVVKRFYETHKDAVLEVFAGTYDASERALLSRETDLAFVRIPMRLPGFAIKRQFESELVCVMPHGHALAGRESIGARELDGEPLVLLWRHSELRQGVDAAFRDSRISQTVVAEVHSVSVACAMAASGIGVAIVSRLIATSCQTGQFVMRRFEPSIRFATAIATLANEPVSETAEAFADALGDALDELGRA